MIIYSQNNCKDEYNIWRFICHMAAPLQYLHAQHPPVIHRDFKPDNILAVSKSNGRIQWKIADFGVARVLSENAYGEYYAQTDIGTPIYMAPEALAVGTLIIVYVYIHMCNQITLQFNCKVIFF